MFFARYRATMCLPIVSLLFLANSAVAVPDSINYQGYLTDSNGAPVDATVDITFRLYDVATGGTDLWNETDTVEIVDGKFTTPLGDGTAFPFNLFAGAPLFLGIDVDADGEMSPRKPLSTAPYAFKAGDADTLQGMQSTDFISSSSQIIAFDGIDMGGMGSIDGVDSLQFDTGAGGGITFSDGTTQSSGAVNSILAADGAGSTLDADLVDGMQASEIIDAASDEVRIPISSLPFTISQSGSYYLTQDLSISIDTTAIDIDVDDVTLDLMGFTLTGPGQTNGIFSRAISFSFRSNITIKNGTVQQFPNSGITCESNPVCENVKIESIRSLNNGRDGIFVDGDSNIVQNCIVEGNTRFGINARDTGALIQGNTAKNNGFSGINAGSGSLVLNNTVIENLAGGITAADGSVIQGNSVRQNSGDGIDVLDGAVVRNNAVIENTAIGIDANQSANISNNSVHENGGIGIVATAGARIVGNTVQLNDDNGIEVLDGNLIKDNVVRTNNISQTVDQGGIVMRDDNQVIGNTLDNNRLAHIVVDASDNVVEGNVLTDCFNAGAGCFGIQFNAAGNFYANNRAAGNFDNYGGTLPAGSGNGGGNAEF